MGSFEITHMTTQEGRNFGVIINNRDFKDPLQLDRDEIIALFKEHGALLFRGFGFKGPESMAKFTESYGRDFITHPSVYRGKVNEEDTIQTVDYGPEFTPLHTEMSFLPPPLPPEMAFFFCIRTSGMGGQTTLCDGTEVVPRLSEESRRLLETQRFRFLLTFPDVLWQRFFRTTSREELRNILEERKVNHCLTINDDNVLYLDRVTSGLTQPKFTDRPAYANNILFYYVKQVAPVTMENGDPVPESFNEEVLAVTNSLTAEVHWQVDDLLMFDNTRMLHGRRDFGDNDRMIYTRFCATAF
jgi:alpha-ketoglutarate-dependent taurine dioxygenase